MAYDPFAQRYPPPAAAAAPEPEQWRGPPVDHQTEYQQTETRWDEYHQQHASQPDPGPSEYVPPAGQAPPAAEYAPGLPLPAPADPTAAPPAPAGKIFPAMASLVGRLLLLCLAGVETVPRPGGQGGTVRRASVHVVILDGEPITTYRGRDGDVPLLAPVPVGRLLSGMYIGQQRVVVSLERAGIGQWVLARLTREQSSAGNPAYVLGVENPGDAGIARSWMSAYQRNPAAMVHRV